MHQLRNKRLWAIALWGVPAIYFSPSFCAIASAHNVKTSGNIAANFHIEPNHNPKAGQPSQAWFALTKAGGEPVPLAECNCQLTVYDSQKQAVLKPDLKSISAEQYQGIPGAEIVFPKAGIYTLEISGTPKEQNEFQPFKLAYTVTVQGGQAPAAQVPAQEVSAAPRQAIPVAAIAGAGGAIVAAGCAFWFVKRSRKKPANLDNKGE